MLLVRLDNRVVLSVSVILYLAYILDVCFSFFNGFSLHKLLIFATQLLLMQPKLAGDISFRFLFSERLSLLLLGYFGLVTKTVKVGLLSTLFLYRIPILSYFLGSKLTSCGRSIIAKFAPL